MSPSVFALFLLSLHLLNVLFYSLKRKAEFFIFVVVHLQQTTTLKYFKRSRERERERVRTELDVSNFTFYFSLSFLLLQRNNGQQKIFTK